MVIVKKNLKKKKSKQISILQLQQYKNIHIRHSTYKAYCSTLSVFSAVLCIHTWLTITTSTLRGFNCGWKYELQAVVVCLFVLISKSLMKQFEVNNNTPWLSVYRQLSSGHLHTSKERQGQPQQLLRGRRVGLQWVISFLIISHSN